jgi:hypothetical protein
MNHQPLDLCSPFFRPDCYWTVPERMSANIKGEFRRIRIEEAIKLGIVNSVPEEVFADSLDPLFVEQLSMGQPCFTTGEHLPDYLDDEVEIARMVFGEGTWSVTSVRARRVGALIYYRVVDEEQNPLVWSPRSSDKPLDFQQLVELINGLHLEGYEDLGSGPNAIRDIHFPANMMAPVEAADFIRVYSPYYPFLELHFQEQAFRWLGRHVSKFNTDTPRPDTELPHTRQLTIDDATANDTRPEPISDQQDGTGEL